MDVSFHLSTQNVVMLMSDIVDWLIPDIPKDISVQIHKEKILLVDLFMKEEQGKVHIQESKIPSKEKEKCGGSNNNNNSTTARPRTGPHTNSLWSEQCRIPTQFTLKIRCHWLQTGSHQLKLLYLCFSNSKHSDNWERNWLTMSKEERRKGECWAKYNVKLIS